MRSPASNVETFGGRRENSKNENRFIVIVVVVAVAAAAVAVVVVLVVIAVLIVVVSRACANTLLSGVHSVALPPVFLSACTCNSSSHFGFRLHRDEVEGTVKQSCEAAADRRCF